MVRAAANPHILRLIFLISMKILLKVKSLELIIYDNKNLRVYQEKSHLCSGLMNVNAIEARFLLNYLI